MYMLTYWVGAWKRRIEHPARLPSVPSFIPFPRPPYLCSTGSAVKCNNYPNPVNCVLPPNTYNIRRHILLHWTGSSLFIWSQQFLYLLFCLILECFKKTFVTCKFHPFKTILHPVWLATKKEKLIKNYIKYIS